MGILMNPKESWTVLWESKGSQNNLQIILNNIKISKLKFELFQRILTDLQQLHKKNVVVAQLLQKKILQIWRNLEPSKKFPPMFQHP